MQYKFLKTLLAMTGGSISYYLGGWDIMIQTLVLLAIIDYLTGIIVALYLRELSSKIGFRGIMKKVMMFVVVCVASLVDDLIGKELIRNVTIFFYISNEGISILENANKIDLPIPDKLKIILKHLNKDKESERNDKNGDV